MALRKVTSCLHPKQIFGRRRQTALRSSAKVEPSYSPVLTAAVAVMGLVPGRALPSVLFTILLLSQGYFRWVSGFYSRSVLVIKEKHESALPVVATVAFCPTLSATCFSWAIYGVYRFLSRLKVAGLPVGFTSASLVRCAPTSPQARTAR